MFDSEYSLVSVRFELLKNIQLKIVARNNEIDLFAAQYAMQRLDNGRKANSIKADQESILNLYRFCESSQIDLLARVANLEPLTVGEVESLSLYSSYRRNSDVLVDSGLYTLRMRVARTFINFLWMFYEDRVKRDAETLTRAKLLHEGMAKRFDLYMRAPYRSNRKDRVGLNPELQLQFFKIIDPSSENLLNPWKAERVRWRNYVLFLLLILGGNRKGETLLLKLNHFQLVGVRKYYDILKSDASDYPRAEAPSVKTLGRQVRLSNELAELIEHYITKIRKQYPFSSSSSYLFLSSRDGLPLSVQTPNAALNELIAKHPEFDGVLSPHRLRNTFHDILNDELDAKYASAEALSRHLAKSPIQEFAGGWVKGSSMPSHYAKGSIKTKLDNMQLQIQTKIIKASATSD